MHVLVIANFRGMQLAKVEPPEEDPDSGETPAFTSSTVLKSKAVLMLLYFAAFALVSTQFTTSLKITHRALRMRRRAMVPFAIFLFATSLIPIGFILTQTFLGDPLAVSTFFFFVMLANSAGIALRCVLRPVMIQEYPMQDTFEGCENAGLLVGCLLLVAMTWILDAAGASLGIVWVALPVVLGAFGRYMPHCLCCCYPEQYAMAMSHMKSFRRWYDDRARMSVFTDGVLAIAATFTLLEIRAPVQEESAAAPVGQWGGNSSLPAGLIMDAPANTFSAYILQHWNDFSSYFDSFSVILLLWATHRDIGAALPRFGGLLRRLNMACCMIAALIPFGMSLRETFPRDTVADLFAVGVVFLSSGALLCMPCLGRWLVRGPHRLPPIMLQVGEDEGEEDDGGDTGGARRSRGGAAGAATRSVMGLSAGGASDTRGVAHSLLPGSHVGAEPEEDTAYTPSRLEKQNSSGNDSYYGFLVEDDPAEDYKTDGRMVASAVQELRRSAGYAQPGSPVGSLPGTPGGSASQPLEVMAELAEEEATPPHHPQPAPEALFDDEEEEQEQEDGEPEQDLYAALLVSSRGSGGYSSNELPVEMEEHLVRLLVARAMVLPLMAAMCAATTPFVSILGLNPLLLAWPVVGLIGWAEHSIRSTRGEPWCITRFLLCWRGHPRAIPGVGSVYPMHQGPCSWMYRCRRLRAFLCCDPSQDMDDRAAVTSRVAVSTAARAYEHGKDELGDDDHTTSGPGWGAWGEDMPGLAQAVSRGSINGHRDAMVTELTASSLR